MTQEEPLPDVLIWLDLEMTGLDAQNDVIVEIAALATDTELRALDEGIDLVVHQPDDVLDTMLKVVRKMHARSGLTDEIRASALSLEDAGKQVLDYVRRHAPKPRTVPLCGNSIGVDRRFLARYLPDLEEHLHYRSIDVSSVKELCRRWYPDAHDHRPDKAEGHRALADVHESIAELAYYREAIFR
jgi:oligoribonuclease